MTRRLWLLALAAAVGCASTSPADHARLVAAQVRSILVVPVMNRSVDVTAPDYFLSTVPIPIAERGYYVFPVNLVKRLLEDDGLADPGLVHAADPGRLASMFGADAVMYITIDRWDARWVLVSTSVTVQVSYVLRDGRTGETLWVGRQALTYSSDSGGGGLLGAVINAAVTKASPNYMPLAHQANARALAYPGPGFPSGPHHPAFGTDWTPPEGTVVAARPPPARPTPTPTPGATSTSGAAPTPAAKPASTPAATVPAAH